MKVLVTGASGFIGSHVTARLLEQGHEVAAFSRHGMAPQPGVQSLQGDVVTGEGLAEAMKDIGAVIHLVGIIREGRGNATFEKVHVAGTQQVLAAARAAGVARYVHMSALGASADSASGYAATKARAEALVKDSGLDWTILRPSLAFGVGGEFFGKILKSLVQLPPVIPQIGNGQFPFRPVWVGDVALAFGRALERPDTVKECYELVGPIEYSFRELLELLRDTLGLKKPIVSVPLPLMRLMVPLLQILPNPPITKDQFLMLIKGNTGNPARARAAFDLTMTALPEQLPDILTAKEAAQ